MGVADTPTQLCEYKQSLGIVRYELIRYTNDSYVVF